MSAQHLWRSAPRSICRTTLRGLSTRIDPSKLTPVSPTLLQDRARSPFRLQTDPSPDLLSTPVRQPRPVLCYLEARQTALGGRLLTSERCHLDRCLCFLRGSVSGPQPGSEALLDGLCDIKSAFHHIPLAPMLQTLASMSRRRPSVGQTP